jgi:CHAT domain-containing protein
LGLGQALLGADDAARAEPYLRASYVAGLAQSGGKNASVSAVRVGLVQSLLIQGQCRAIIRLADGEAVTAPDLTTAIAGIQSVSVVNDVQSQLQAFGREMEAFSALQASGDYVGAVQHARLMEAESRKEGEDSPLHNLGMLELGMALQMNGQFKDAEPYLRRARLEGLQAIGGRAFLWLPLVLVSIQLDRMADARALLVPLAEDAAKAQDPAGAFIQVLLVQTDLALDRPVEAERWARAAVALSQSKPSATGYNDVSAIQALAGVLASEGMDSEALKLEQALRARLKKPTPKLAPRQRDLLLAQTDAQLADLLSETTRTAETLQLIEEAVRLETGLYGTSANALLPVQVERARILLRAGHPADALVAFRSTCQRLRILEPSLTGQKSVTSSCEWGYANAVMAQSPSTSGAGDLAQFEEGFAAAQRALNSQAGSAIATAGARVRAAGGDAAALVGSYEASLARRNALDTSISKLAADTSERTSSVRSTLSARRDTEDATIRDAARQISERFPDYWTLVAQSPVSLNRLQRGETGHAPLLRTDEALVIWMAPSRGTDGMVIAISRKGQAWARLPMDGASLSKDVAMLRGQIDPCGYETRQSNCAVDTPPSFSASTAHRLYKALLGDDAIQAVVEAPEIKTLMIVPSGPLLALPPSVLVVADPGKDTARDVSAEAMRATDWLIKHQAIAVLPSVSSLSTLRNSAAALRADGSPRAPGGLFMLADPLYGDRSAPASLDCKSRGQSAPTERADEVGPAALRAALAQLCPLPGTRQEAKALMALFHGKSGDLLEGRDAREARLRMEPAKSRLEHASVVAFATHGLLPGQLGLSEPALALAAPLPAERDDDGLFTASKAAALKLHADWVILSACNTASSDAPRSEGVSGLSRAFFYAGAKSLLVSNWRIGDEEAALITSRTLALYMAGSSKAEALRQASMKTMRGSEFAADEQDRFAFPSAWAPFTLVGEPD